MNSIVLRRTAIAASLAFALGSCGSERFSESDFFGLSSRPAGVSATAPVDMTGRWRLVSPGYGECAMTFRSAPGAAEGTIAPEGGCPGDFFTSRKFVFEQSGLVIRNHNGEPLAQLSMAAATRFDGKSVTGEAIILTR